MDANKLEVLRSIGYAIAPHCGLCAWSELSADGWGTCGAHEYAHVKHSQARSRLSVHRAGWCPRFTMSEDRLAEMGLHGFGEFVREERGSGGEGR